MALNRSATSFWTSPHCRAAPDSLVQTGVRFPVSDGTLIHFVDRAGASQAYTVAGVRQSASDVSAGSGAPASGVLTSACLIAGWLYLAYRGNSSIYRREWSAGSDLSVWSATGNLGLICGDDTYIYTTVRASPNDYSSAVQGSMNRVRLSDGSISTWASPDNAFRSQIFTDGQQLFIGNPWGMTAHRLSAPVASRTSDQSIAPNSGPLGSSNTQTNSGFRGGMAAVGSRYFISLDTTTREYTGLAFQGGADTVTHLAPPAPARVSNIRIGSATPSRIYVGGTRIRRAYVGSVEVWNDPE